MCSKISSAAWSRLSKVRACTHSQLGGQMLLAGLTPHKEIVLDALRWFGDEAERVGVDTRLNQPVDMSYVHEVAPDQVVLDLYEELVDAGYEAYRIGNNERAVNFLNATRSAFELAYTI